MLRLGGEGLCVLSKNGLKSGRFKGKERSKASYKEDRYKFKKESPKSYKFLGGQGEENNPRKIKGGGETIYDYGKEYFPG